MYIYIHRFVCAPGAEWNLVQSTDTSYIYVRIHIYTRGRVEVSAISRYSAHIYICIHTYDIYIYICTYTYIHIHMCTPKVEWNPSKLRYIP